MLKKRVLPLLALAALVAMPGCLSGPSYLSRSVDDLQNRHYADSPFGSALLTDVLPVYPVLKFLAAVPDYLLLNPVQFWGFDVWDGEGAAFDHKDPSSAKVPFWQT